MVDRQAATAAVMGQLTTSDTVQDLNSVVDR
jgi:hypothetical protein